jgi:hypothetical protein
MKYDLLYWLRGSEAVYLRYKVTGENLFIGNLPISVLLIDFFGSFLLGDPRDNREQRPDNHTRSQRLLVGRRLHSF